MKVPDENEGADHKIYNPILSLYRLRDPALCVLIQTGICTDEKSRKTPETRTASGSERADIRTVDQDMKQVEISN